MATLKKTVNDTYYWSIDRICELCSRGDFEEVVNGDSIRQEFDEWISANKGNLDEDIISMAYIGEGSEYDICLLYTSPSPRDRQKSRMPSSA